MPKVDWVGDGDKFALIGLDVNLDRSFDVLKIDESATAVAGGQFTLPEHWQEWLGTIRVEEVQGCTLFMAIRATDKSSGVLDEQSQLLSNRVHDWCTGLILASDFVSMSGYAFIAGGSRSGDEVDIRQFGPIKAPARSIVNSMKPIARESLQRAWMISLSIGKFRNLPIQDTWRLS
jgi:hypothetical protein